MKRQIHITFDDLDDYKKVINTFVNLIKSMVAYYLDKEKYQELNYIMLYLGQYIGSLLQAMGYKEEDFKDLQGDDENDVQ